MTNQKYFQVFILLVNYGIFSFCRKKTAVIKRNQLPPSVRLFEKGTTQPIQPAFTLSQSSMHLLSQSSLHLFSQHPLSQSACTYSASPASTHSAILACANSASPACNYSDSFHPASLYLHISRHYPVSTCSACTLSLLIPATI